MKFTKTPINEAHEYSNLWGAHGGIIEDFSLLGCDTERLGFAGLWKKPREKFTQIHLSKKKGPQGLGYNIL